MPKPAAPRLQIVFACAAPSVAGLASVRARRARAASADVGSAADRQRARDDGNLSRARPRHGIESLAQHRASWSRLLRAAHDVHRRRRRADRGPGLVARARWFAARGADAFNCARRRACSRSGGCGPRSRCRRSGTTRTRAKSTARGCSARCGRSLAFARHLTGAHDSSLRTASRPGSRCSRSRSARSR